MLVAYLIASDMKNFHLRSKNNGGRNYSSYTIGRKKSYYVKIREEWRFPLVMDLDDKKPDTRPQISIMDSWERKASSNRWRILYKTCKIDQVLKFIEKRGLYVDKPDRLSAAIEAELTNSE